MTYLYIFISIWKPLFLHFIIAINSHQLIDFLLVRFISLAYFVDCQKNLFIPASILVIK